MTVKSEFKFSSVLNRAELGLNRGSNGTLLATIGTDLRMIAKAIIDNIEEGDGYIWT